MKTLWQKFGVALPIMAVSMMFTSSSAVAQTGSADHNVRLTEGGRTTVAFAQAFTSALTSVGVAITTEDTGVIRGGHVYLPVVAGGMADLTTGRMQMLHSGSIVFSGAGNTITLSALILDTTASAPVISALFSVNNMVLGRMNVFDVALPATTTLPLTAPKEVLEIDGAALTLDPAIATSLNAVYQANVFQAGYNIGTADLIAFLL